MRLNRGGTLKRSVYGKFIRDRELSDTSTLSSYLIIRYFILTPTLLTLNLPHSKQPLTTLRGLPPKGAYGSDRLNRVSTFT